MNFQKRMPQIGSTFIFNSNEKEKHARSSKYRNDLFHKL